MGKAPVVLLLLLLAGCSAPAADPDPPTTDAFPSSSISASSTAAPPPSDAAAPTLPRLDLKDCTNFGGVFPVAMDIAQAALPDGFTPVRSPSDPAGGATLYVLGVRCNGSAIDGIDAGAVDLAYAELAVVPPKDYAVPGRDDATVPLFFGAQPGPVADVLAQYRVGLAGAAGITWDALTPAAGIAITAELGSASFSLGGEVLATPPQSLSSGDFVVYGVQDGVVHTTLLGSSAGGEGQDATVLLEPDGGVPALDEARPLVRGFSVSGFSLHFEVRTPQTP